MHGWINVAEAGGLQQALDALPEQGGTVHVPAGTWEVSETVEVRLTEGRHLFLVGDGRASVLVNTQTSGEPLLHLVGVEGSWWPDLKITIRDLTFAGNHDSGDALAMEWPNDTMVDACFFIGHGGTAVNCMRNSTNVTVRDCWMRDCRRALAAENLHHLTMHGCQTRSLKEGQIQDEHVYIDKNCREVRIVGNHFAYGHAEGIILDGTAQQVISGNTLEGFTTQIYAVDTRDMVIADNYLHGGKSVHMVGECNGFTITGNTMINATEGGVVIEDARGSGGHVIANNIIRKSVYRDIEYIRDKRMAGVLLGDALNCVVTGNVIEDVTEPVVISAGPGGGGHVITANRIIRPAAQAVTMDCEVPCTVEANMADNS
ncbi:MAG: right-handed parallel beta-helix repeat-containing protein [Armatimonadetes bacterium]|nr:right-handed parallel beta-helix repeat-containing protein [Armatimonadota bacterium]